MGVRRDRPFAVQPRANRAMALALRAATLLSLGTAVLAVALDSRPLGWAAVTVVGVVPVLRVGWLAVRWAQRRDWLFAGLAAALVAVIAAGAALAAITG